MTKQRRLKDAEVKMLSYSLRATSMDQDIRDVFWRLGQRGRLDV